MRDETCRGKDVVRIKVGMYGSEFQDFKAEAFAHAPVAMARLVAMTCKSPGPGGGPGSEQSGD